MVVRVHDIIKVTSVNKLVFLTEKPMWVDQAIENNPYVIVRRAPIIDEFVPIGIRGSKRHERMSGYVLKSEIKEILTPEMITKRLNGIDNHILIKKTLEKIDSIMNKLNLKWGVFGSIAYEVVTGKLTINKKSDIDLIIRNGASKEKLNRLVCQLKILPIRVDILIETSYGGYNLKEYLSKKSSQLLIKTNYDSYLISKSKLIV